MIVRFCCDISPPGSKGHQLQIFTFSATCPAHLESWTGHYDLVSVGRKDGRVHANASSYDAARLELARWVVHTTLHCTKSTPCKTLYIIIVASTQSPRSVTWLLASSVVTVLCLTCESALMRFFGHYILRHSVVLRYK